MNVIRIVNQFTDQQSCIEYLETVRWGKQPYCPYCGSLDIARKEENGKIGRWNCHLCKSSFNVLAKTMFARTRVSLQKWFLAISLVANAKKSVSSYQLARDLGITQPTALYMQHRIRAEMARKSSPLLKGILEADETFLGGKPRRRKDDDGNLPPPSPRGRGTKKTKVLGVVQRGGAVAARVVTNLGSSVIMKFIKQFTRPKESTLMTDEYKGYLPVKSIMKHNVIKHAERKYVDEDDPSIHTNTIEGFWSLLKRAWYGTHHHYSKKHSPLYVAEACYKYNHRNKRNIFDVFMRGCFA